MRHHRRPRALLSSTISYLTLIGSTYRRRCNVVGDLMRHQRRLPARPPANTLAPYRISRCEWRNELLLVTHHDWAR
eukprot:scaffold4320_cov72-Skeletonema_dohrnii-CCMP3373.AAC.2